jgi:hypothetical protein
MKTIRCRGKIFIERPALVAGTCYACEVRESCFLDEKECDKTIRFVRMPDGEGAYALRG